MKTNTKNLLDALTLEEISAYLDKRTDVVFNKITTTENFVAELNDRFELQTTKEQWQQACLDDGIHFNSLGYDFYNLFDENSYDPDLFDMTWQDMVEDEIKGTIKGLKREQKLNNLLA